MSKSVFDRLSGVALLLGGLVAIVALIFHPSDIAAPRSAPAHVALYAAVMLVLLGLPGLGAAIARRSRVLGLSGMVLLFFGLAFEDPLHSVLAFTVIPVLAANPDTRPLLQGPPPPTLMAFQIGAGPLILLGMIGLAVALWRMDAAPWLVGVLALGVVGVVIAFAIPPLGIGPGLIYLSLAVAGAALLAGPRVRIPQA
jgi:hypothetical protein